MEDTKFSVGDKVILVSHGAEAWIVLQEYRSFWDENIGNFYPEDIANSQFKMHYGVHWDLNLLPVKRTDLIWVLEEDMMPVTELTKELWL